MPELAVAAASSEPGWSRLYRHSRRLGFRWLARGRYLGSFKVGLARLLVPLDPWRYYEMGKAAEEVYSGSGLDVSSPKLLMSLLQSEGRGDWIGIDLFSKEIEAWRRIDPALHLEVADATSLPYSDEQFDHCLCVSVVEHINGSGDTRALDEMWRVLRPGGTLILTTNVAAKSRELFVDHEPWGEASVRVEGRVFYERHYSPPDIEVRLLGKPWTVLTREYAMEIDRSIHDDFVRRMPWSTLTGGRFRRRCPDNFKTSASPEILSENRHGVVYLKLQKPE